MKHCRTENKIDCTVLVSVKNEEKNIAQCLNALLDFEKVIVIDSYSSDNTKEICKKFGVDVLDFDYQPPYPKKRQWALDNVKMKTAWVLLLDADELIGNNLRDELRELHRSPKLQGIFITKNFYFLGKRLRFGGFDFKALLMFRLGAAKFEEISFSDNGLDMEIHERLLLNGETVSTQFGLEHLDWNSFTHYIGKHNNYSSWEADVRTRVQGEKAVQPKLFGNIQERRRFLKKIVQTLPFEPVIWFLYHYIFRLGLLDGRRGLTAAVTRSFYIFMVRTKIIEKRFRGE